MINLRNTFLALFITLSALLDGQVMWQIKKDTIVKWYYFDGDEFNGSSVDQEKWIPAYSYSKVNYRFDYLMTPKRLEYGNGICKFTCYQDTGLAEIAGWQLDSNFRKEYGPSIVDGNKFRYLYTCGNVWSKGQYGKGYFEMRFKTTDCYGMWPAFWLYGNNQKDEIDFFELKGEREKSIHVATHCPSGCDNNYKHSLFPKPFSGWIKANADLTKDYNVISGEWQDGYVKWYLNGEGIAYFDGDFASQQMSLIIGTGPAKKGFGFAPGINETSYFPNSLDVDYVRVWYKEGTPKGEIKGNKETSFDYLKTETKKDASPRKKIGYMFSKKAFKGEDLTVSVLPASGKNIIVTALGKDINYTITVITPAGKEILSQSVTTSYSKFDLSQLATHPQVKVRIKTPFGEVEDTISLR
jgi:beta-glucanase (GH16 family)